jgi:hypothetical protein
VTTYTREAWATGERPWFEYHCWESEQSSDAQMWFRSHEQVEVLAHDAADHDCLRPLPYDERAESCQPCLYTIRFNDGFTGTCFEDELFANTLAYERPDPPKYTVDMRA